MATKATTKKAAPKKAAAKKAIKTDTLITFHETKSKHLAALLGMDKARAKEIQAITRKAIEDNDGWRGSFEQLLTATAGSNELVYAAFSMGAFMEQLRSSESIGVNLLDLLLLDMANKEGLLNSDAPRIV